MQNSDAVSSNKLRFASRCSVQDIAGAPVRRQRITLNVFYMFGHDDSYWLSLIVFVAYFRYNIWMTFALKADHSPKMAPHARPLIATSCLWFGCRKWITFLLPDENNTQNWDAITNLLVQASCIRKVHTAVHIWIFHEFFGEEIEKWNMELRCCRCLFSIATRWIIKSKRFWFGINFLIRKQWLVKTYETWE